jgi:AcrR family transcriptional regulator
MNAVLDSSISEESVRTSLQERKQEFARNAIWDAAIDLFFEKGFDETTVDEIATRAGTSRRSFFRHFESKNDLMAQPVVDWGIALASTIDSCPHSMSITDVLHEVVFKVAQESASNPRSRKLMQIAAKYPAARDAQLSRVAGVQDRLAQAFGKRSKDSITVHLLAGLIFAVLGTAHQIWFEKDEKDISVVAQKVFAALSRIVSDIDHSTARVPSRRTAKR